RVIAREPAAPFSPWFPIGTALLVTGSAGLVYPCFVTREEVAALHAEMPLASVLAVALAGIGIAMLVRGLHLTGTDEPPFSPEEEAKYERWWPRVRLVLPPFAFVYLPRFLWETWREIDREAAREREARAAAGETGYDWAP